MAPAADRFALPGTTAEVEAGQTFTPKFDAAGVLAAVATDADTGEVLMFAWMNAEALALTIETGEAHFFSRSRKRLWKKGEESGNVLRVVEMRTDCDQDAIWMKVRITGHGVACHTGRRSCFYRSIPVPMAPAETARLSSPKS
jgi:phosphoribosyl-AMP cyclohydrolase